MKCKQTLEKRGKSCGVNRPFCLFCLVAALPQPMRRPYITAIAAAAGFTPQSHSPIAASRPRCRKSAPTPPAKPKPRLAKPPLQTSKPAKARPKRANPSRRGRLPSPKQQTLAQLAEVKVKLSQLEENWLAWQEELEQIHREIEAGSFA